MWAAMERIKSFFAVAKATPDEYEPLNDERSPTLEGSIYEGETPFSWIEYSIFALIGVAMLWAWNMFLAAAPYFQTRFQSDPWLLANSQSAILTTSTSVNLIAMLVLTNIQSSANYPFRINAALLIMAAIFSLLTISTTSFLDVSPSAYLAFVLLMVALASWGAGLMQNGAFAFAASFGRPEYTQAIMAGQGVAGILPPLTQMLSFLAFSSDPDNEQDAAPTSTNRGTAAFIYFLTAVVIAALALASFIPLLRRHTLLLQRRSAAQETEPLSFPPTDRAPPTRHHVPLPALLRKLRWLAASVFLCFVVAMFFPVFTAKILSVHTPGRRSSSNDGGGNRIFAPGAFIPLGFFFWNLGDLAGRVATMLPAARPLQRRPKALFGVALARVGFLPLYLLCNLHGDGARVGGDLFYLLVVQFPFGLTNGWLGASAMMAAGEWVAEGEREAAGGFMGLCLVGGLAVGSVLSFSVAGV
ncbi:hypothetical protein BT67DRAFT_396734 [Trichocladium antarcticum]|uniref:Nucleoside transporter FUN26 n=1 Tax=Trichocladium antarcticum TaxID=1450529 RepID=A0AAN6UU09_9PEZI|nr:hypothetical protein BT67DRAFT_396734 [Trichocladium antarcticum]